MDTSKIIKGVVSNGRYTVTAPIVKEDYGLYLKIEGVELPQTYEVDFSNSENSGTSVTMIGNADGVLIPRQFIDSGKDVFAFLYHVGEDFGRTVYKFRIPNKVRPDRTNEEPTPEEQSVIDQAISALNTAVAQTAEDVNTTAENASRAYDYAEEADSSATDARNYANNAQTSANSASASASQASASASASAQSASQSAQIKADVEDLADDAQGYAQSAEASAQNAHTYALSANVASSTAENFADVASGYASQAQSSAQTASAKAQEASQSATTASQKATESAQSATNASQSAQTAEQAKTASQTAQGLAESARDSAISAKNDAESARDDAESARDEAVQAVASISGALDDKADVITDTASGAVASFPDGADDLPLKSLVVNIDPVQDLHGYDSPWVGGAGINKLPPMVDGTYTGNGLTAVVKNGVATFSGTSTASGNALTIPLTEEYTVTQGYLHLCNSVANASFAPSLESEDISATAVSFACSPVNRVAAIPSDKIGQKWTRVRVWISSGVTVSGIYAPMVCEDDTVRPYAPYENICPISGWTGMQLNANGTTIPISWQTEAGTVYGGKLDVLTGKLMIEWVSYVLDGTTRKAYEIFQMSEDSEFTNLRGLYYVKFADLVNTAPYSGNVYMCSHFKWFGYSNRRLATPDSIWYGSSKKEVYWASSTFTTLEEFNQYLVDQYNNGTPVTLVYQNGVTTEIQLTSHEVNSLLGQNNIFANTGDTVLEYRADTKLYIERLTAPDSVDMIADANIVSGQYFMVGNSLYKATANIANGAQIIVGTNCIRKSLSEALNEINA